MARREREFLEYWIWQRGGRSARDKTTSLENIGVLMARNMGEVGLEVFGSRSGGNSRDGAKGSDTRQFSSGITQQSAPCGEGYKLEYIVQWRGLVSSTRHR